MKLALGTAQFGLPYGIANQSGQVSRPIAASMLELARSKGVDTLDTAITYGESEACLGELGVRQFKVITKLPAVPLSTEDIAGWLKNQITGSLGRLGVDAIYGLLLHRPDQLLGVDGHLLFKALQEAKDAGLVEKIGISIYAPSELDSLIPKYQIDLVQAPFNIVDRRLLSSGWLKRLKQENIEIHTRSAFLQGLLLMPQDAIPQKFSAWSEVWGRWHTWLVQNQKSSLQACIAYPLSFAEIDRVVVGVDSREQFSQIIDIALEGNINGLPDLSCDDENLINPSRWSQL